MVRYEKNTSFPTLLYPPLNQPPRSPMWGCGGLYILLGRGERGWGDT